MGIINQGILGGFSGKVGNVVGTSWKGIDVMRVMPASVANPQTAGQLNQRQKFSLIMGFLQPLAAFLKISFKNFAIRMSGINAAMRYNLRSSVAGTYPDYTVDYPNAVLAKGNLVPSLNQAAASTVAGVVNFTWDNNSGEAGANATDKTLLVVYNPGKHQVIAANQLADRSAGTQNVTVPASFTGDLVHCYMAFITDDNTKVSDSRYAGSVTVA